ncbi:hypothetical protein EYY60_15270 [Flavobacterium zhairuonense]|uniref:hypothetical protein n=1 Tax=Flavobacterium zhairuonense TaxID=2493631 RepID=UPI00104CEFDA|nr:hypothetical protein [Flavobacterium zhairuonense]KAF2508488.1 hypothetical protein EYY60_15270 [Flavobacterium zhairuonense]
MVNKFRKYIINNPITFSLLVVYCCFIYLKVANLDNYNFYEGKVIGLHKISSKYSGAGRGSGWVRISREIPEIEYYKNYDTIKCDQGELRLVTNFKINEKLIVLEDKENEYEVKIYSLFYYWIDYNELILCLLGFLFVYGYIRTFMI